MSMIHQIPVDTVEAVALTGDVNLAKVAQDRALHEHANQYFANRRYVAQVLMTSAPLVLADLLSVLVAMLIAFPLAGTLAPTFLGPHSNLILLFLPGVLLIVNTLWGLYPGTGLHPVAEMRQTCIGAVLAFAGFIGANLVDRNEGGALALLVACLLSVLLLPTMRSIARSVCSRFSAWGQPVIVFGENSTGTANYEFLKGNPRLGLRPIGIVGDVAEHWGVSDGGSSDAFLGPPEEAESIARRHGVFWAIIAMPDRSPEEIRKVIERHASTFPHVLVLPNMKQLPSLWNRAWDCGGAPAFHIESSLMLPLPRLLKQAFDLATVVIGGTLCLPMIAAIALLIRLSSPGPVFYSQKRIARGGRTFQAWKFRTMVSNAAEVLENYLAADPNLRQEWEDDHKLKNDPRVTSIGRFLRKTSLDELPQIWNVLLGEMSLVGPRPIVNEEIPKYQDCFDLYAKVRPGITGLWQISGRNNTTYAERVQLDSYYVRNWSPWLDLYILFRTIKVVLFREGAY